MSATLTIMPAAAAQPPTVPAEQKSDSRQYELNFSKGVAAFNQARYADAETAFAEAVRGRPDDRDARFYLAQTLLRLKRYGDAEREFAALLDRDATFARARLGLGMALYYQERFPEALDALSAAETVLPRDPLVTFFQGLALNRVGQYDQAADAFTRAMELSPELAPEAHYQRGVADYGRGRLTQARADFDAAIAADPSAPVAESARGYLRLIGLGPAAIPATAMEAAKEAKRWDITATTSMQYDSNVVLLPLGVQPPGGSTGISRHSDVRWVFSGRGEYRFLQSDTWTVGAGYGLYQSLHHTLSGFDVQDHNPLLYVQHRFGAVQTRVDYLFNYVTVGRDPFLISNAIRPVITIREADRYFTQIQTGYQTKDFKSDRFQLNSVRDGTNWVFGVTQFFHFPERGMVLRAGYFFDTDRTGGVTPAVANPNVHTSADWSYIGHRFTVGAVLPAVWTLKPDVTFDYYRQNYDAPNSFSPGGRTVRQDDIFIVSAGFTRPILSWLAVGAQYSYTRDKSNVALFNYDRSILSLSLTGTF